MHSPARPRYYYGWNIVIVALLMNVAASPTNAVAFSFFVAPMSDDLGWSRGALSLALTFRLGVAGFTAPLTGMLVDRIGARALGSAAGAIAGLSMMALFFVHDLWLFYLLFAISGLSGFGGPAGQLLTTVPVAKWFYLKRGRAMALSSVGMPLGTAAFIPFIQEVISISDWRTGWLVSGALVFILAVPICLLLMRKDPEALGLYPDGMTKEQHEATSKRSIKNVSDEDWTVKQAVRSQAFWMLIGSVALTGIVIQGTLVYRTSYWEDIGISDSVVGLGTAMDPLTVIFAGLFFGFLAERVAARYLGFFGSLGVAASMLPMMVANGSVWNLFAHNILWGASQGANITVNNIIWPNYFGRLHLGSIRGLMFPVAIGTAAASPPVFALLIGLVSETRYVWFFSLAAYALSGLLILLCRPPRLPKKAAEVRAAEALA
ncbi:MAG: MFS transporter [Dehalococcoidia bacterium]